MTKKLSISVPDDVAETLAAQPNASAFIAEAVRAHRARLATQALLAGAGYTVTGEGVERMRARLEAVRAAGRRSEAA
ncbi:hypothetical protein J2S43_001917 [Catenuloplanes nepalensis]|uniref:CopG family transcriptional regulator n=1 Tax=Catenuloplanes nepalensis TaxID=587533 RepID=A0ABT9MPQ8_9ACTN|nr:hypothetical protein [Catenuloplanes nepalensis]MDP9793405.1 hypothetical protein [Catenuloplanes nepalensis]